MPTTITLSQLTGAGEVRVQCHHGLGRWGVDVKRERFAVERSIFTSVAEKSPCTTS